MSFACASQSEARKGKPRVIVLGKGNQIANDPVPLTNVNIRVNLPLKVASAHALVGGGKVRARTVGNGVEFALARVPINEVVCLELAG